MISWRYIRFRDIVFVVQSAICGIGQDEFWYDVDVALLVVDSVGKITFAVTRPSAFLSLRRSQARPVIVSTSFPSERPDLQPTKVHNTHPSAP